MEADRVTSSSVTSASVTSDRVDAASDADPGRLHVRIAVLTYQRPKDINEALPRLLAQARQNAGAVNCDIVVVDNDPHGSAEGFVTAFAAQHPDVAVRYENETEPGISAARNRALVTAGECDLLVFIDDDERPSEHWLALLLETYRKHRCAAVVGPVVSEFDVTPDAWVQAGQFFNRRRLPTGTEISVAATNNLLLDLHQIRRLGLSFDPQFGLSGGGDQMFTRDLHHRGGTMIWCNEAIVIDVVPAGRSTREWVLRRQLRTATTESATLIKLAGSTPARGTTRLRLAARGAVRVLAGGGRFAFGTATNSLTHRAWGLRTLWRGAGFLSGAVGYEYKEYRRTAS